MEYKKILNLSLSKYELEDFLLVLMLSIDIVFGWWVIKDFIDSFLILTQDYIGDECIGVFAYSVLCGIGGLVLLIFSLPLAYYASRLSKTLRKITVMIPFIYFIIGIIMFSGLILKSYMQ